MNLRGLTPEDIYAGHSFHGSPEDESTVEPCEATAAGFLVVDHCELAAGHEPPHQATRADGTVARWWDRIDLPSRHRRAA